MMALCLQEIVGNLVTHFGSGFEEETDSSLDILYQLVDKHLDKMASFAIFVKVQNKIYPPTNEVFIFLTFTGIQRHYILFSVYTCTCRNVNGNFVLICKIWL